MEPRLFECGFPVSQLGLGNGVLSAGMSIGGMVAAVISATALLATLGTWRNIVFMWSGAAIVMGIVWLIAAREPLILGAPSLRIPIKESISMIVRVKHVWIVAIFTIGVLACYQGVTGYLPVFLENIGWAPAAAGGALSTFVGVGIITNILTPVISDKVGLRKAFLIGSAFTLAIFILLIYPLGSITSCLWLVVIIAGLSYGGIFPIVMCLLVELKEVGPVYAGTAYGLLLTVQSIGGLLGPTIGAALAYHNFAWPFILWGVWLGIFTIAIFFIRETGLRIKLEKQK